MKAARNDPCPCGSGRKFKHCCARRSSALATRGTQAISLPVQPSAAKPSTRPCGGCTACCTTLIINDANLVVPSGTVCRHECAGGCAIHGPGQPESCRVYQCEYTTSPKALAEADRPDRVGAIVDRRRHPDKRPPMQRTTHVVPCAPDGLRRVLENPTWRSVLRRDLRAGIPILAAQYDDPQNREVLGVHWRDGKLFCRLTSCDADGNPILTTLEPVNDPPIHITLLIPEQGFVFDTQALSSVLGEQSFLVIRPSAEASTNTDLRFYFTRRQAEWAGALEALVREDTLVGAAS